MTKPGWPVESNSTSGTLFLCLFDIHVKTFQEYAVFHLFTKCIDGLFHKITEWCIKYGAMKTNENLLQSSKQCVNIVF